VNTLIYAIVACVSAGSTNYCHLLGEPLVFASAEQCVQALSTRLGPGNLINGRFHSTQARGSNTWYECDQRPTSQWQPVQTQPSQADTSRAAPFKHVPYVLRHCVGAQCEDSSVTSVSEDACAIAKKLASEYDASGRYECVKQ
jgi:hypothetical protein